MNRRDVLKLLSLAGLAAIVPAGISTVSADENKYAGPFWLMLNAGGGWDPTMLCDPKGGTLKSADADPTKYESWTEGSVNHYLKPIDVSPFKAADVNYQPGGADKELYSAQRFLKDHGKDILVINGVDTTTNNHEVGSRVTWSGKTQDGQPSFAALAAALGSSGKDLPLAYISAGGYDTTAGLVALARTESDPRVVQRVAYPNVINVENLGNMDDPAKQFFTNDTAARIAAAQSDRLKAMQAAETLPIVKSGMGALLLARQGTGSLGSLADELSKVDQVTLSKAFPGEFDGFDDNTFGGDFSNLLLQAQLTLHAFHAGVAVAGNLSIGSFDTHSNHDQGQAQQMMKIVRAFDYIMAQAKLLGIDKNLFVVIGSDFGRTPTYNDGRGKDHWNITSMIVSGPQVVGGRVVGATTDKFGPMRVDPKDTSKVLNDDDPAGVRIEPAHVHHELRRVAGLAGTDLDKAWGIPGDTINLFG
jgi:hypothetical protein